MIDKVKPTQRSSCRESCENLASEGLRTLVITQKALTGAQYAEFEGELEKAKTSMTKREVLVQQAIEQLETDMEYLCVTGVEDKLQSNVRLTIEKVRQAGI